MKELFTEKQIKNRVKDIASDIHFNHYYTPEHPSNPITIIGLLTGAFMFYTDLVRNIPTTVNCDFMRVKSYDKPKLQGTVNIISDITTDIKDHHIYIVDDIFDTGNTMKAVVEYLRSKEPKAISIITLLKRKNSKGNWDPFDDPAIYSTHYGFEIDDEWVIGYGLDDESGHSRNFNQIYSI